MTVNTIWFLVMIGWNVGSVSVPMANKEACMTAKSQVHRHNELYCINSQTGEVAQ